MDPARRTSLATLSAAFAAAVCACAAGPGAEERSGGVAGASAAISGNPDSMYDAASGELRVPPLNAGMQIMTPGFDIPPGAEIYACYHTELAYDAPIDVQYYESKMGPGSHHFILYKMDDDSAPIGSLDPIWCVGDFNHQNWIYSAAQPHIDLQMPEGVAVQLKPRQRVMLDMHYINATDQTLKAEVRVNLMFARGAFQNAASMVSYNSDIRVPAHGTQTVSSDCTPGDGAKFFYLLTHTHRHGVLSTVHRVLADGALGEELVRSSDWERPQEGKWMHEPYLTFAPGEKLRIDCSYRNDTDQIIMTGPSAVANEMCMLIAYFHPASADGACH